MVGEFSHVVMLGEDRTYQCGACGCSGVGCDKLHRGLLGSSHSSTHVRRLA